MVVVVVVEVEVVVDGATHYLQAGKEGEEEDRKGGQRRLAQGKGTRGGEQRARLGRHTAPPEEWGERDINSAHAGFCPPL